MFLPVFAAAAAAAVANGAVTTPPDWLKKPSSDALRAIWPKHALQNHIEGRAVISCTANVHGLLEACVVASETPKGEGFGAAALLLAPAFLFRPASTPDGPVASRVNIPVNFKAGSGSGSGSKPPANESPFGAGSLLPPAKTDDSITTVVRPLWASAPTFSEVAAAYPRGAGGTSGHVVLRCKVAASGALKDCTDWSEIPGGKGFARAARTLVGDFRLQMDPGAAGGHSTILVNLPVRLIDPQSAEFRQHRIGEPNWRVTLDPVKVAQVFPQAAADKGLTTGRGVVECTVGVDGALTACQPMPGQPDGLGFSESAAMVAQAMRMSVWTDEGGPVDGATITLPVRFNLGRDGPPAGGAPPK